MVSTAVMPPAPPPFYWVPHGEVAYRIVREQPHEDPDPDAEKVL
jgi:hypothetical protein